MLSFHPFGYVVPNLAGHSVSKFSDRRQTTQETSSESPSIALAPCYTIAQNDFQAEIP